MKKARWSWVGIGLVVSVWACGGGPTGGDGWTGTVTDSAGITVVHNPSTGLWAEGSPWTIEEVFRAGGMDAEAGEQFSLVNGLDVDADGTVFVADQLARQVQVFGADGVHLMTIGQAGEGPGEFGPALTGVYVVGERVLAPDLTNQRVNVFDRSGTFTGTIPFELSKGIPIRWDETPDGGIAIQRRGVAVEGMDALEGGDPVETLPEEGGEPELITTLPKGQSFDIQEGAAPSIKLFETEPIWDLAPSGDLVRAVNSEYRVEWWSGGSLSRVVTLPAEPVEVTDLEKRGVLDALRELMISQGAPPQAVEPILQSVAIADQYPVFAQLLLTTDGTLWVQRIFTSRDAPEGYEWSPQDLGSNEWDVFDGDGRYLGVVALPLRFQALREIDGVFWGVERDDFDVQSVVGYRVVKP